MKLKKFSEIFQPTITAPKHSKLNPELVSQSQKLLTNYGFIQSDYAGLYNLLPLGQKVLDKLVNLVERSMNSIGGQKINLSTLLRSSLLKDSGRYALVESELFKLTDRSNKEYSLAPTHEESITKLLASVGKLSYKQMPLKLYQVTNKYRDEKRPKFGLLRSREFLMKDLYSFDTSLETAGQSYDVLSEAYRIFFDQFRIKYRKVIGDCGNVGGLKSHEFHFVCDIGEDHLKHCKICDHVTRMDLSASGPNLCDQCQSDNVEIEHGIEVGHTYLLGDRYSRLLNANFTDQDGNLKNIVMGCYGIGLTRILAAVVDILSVSDEIRWPSVLAPFSLCIITPKDGSKEYDTAIRYLNRVMNSLVEEKCSIFYDDQLVWDDRNSLSIGKRLMHARNIGIPLILVFGKSLLNENPTVELHDIATRSKKDVSLASLIQLLKELKSERDVKIDAEFEFRNAHGNRFGAVEV